MFTNLVLVAILGHFVGDYLFQPKAVALGKGYHNGIAGFSFSLVHAFDYTAAVISSVIVFVLACPGLRSSGYKPLILFFGIMIPHFIIDHFSLGQVWLDMIQGRNFKECSNKSQTPENNIDLVFSCIVYVVVDNTLHILTMIPILWFSMET